MSDITRTLISCYLTVLSDGGAGVALPSYMIQYPLRLVGGKLVADVLVPDDELTNGTLDEAKIRAKYAGSVWDAEGVTTGVQV